LLSAEPDARRLLLVVDQFEELFTLARSDVEPFQQALLHLAESPTECTCSDLPPGEGAPPDICSNTD
jgi:hypothetical protein